MFFSDYKIIFWSIIEHLDLLNILGIMDCSSFKLNSVRPTGLRNIHVWLEIKYETAMQIGEHLR